ncbi:MAG: hypothetical protein JRN51_08035, partial [Nitrososphaerota archaeon]|nr:hypothetical protein [Nitrososphaerota archaeon]
MKRLVAASLLLFLVLSVLPAMGTAVAQGTPQVSVNSVYTLNRYGFATVNETVRVVNNGSSPIQLPSVTIGFGNLSSDIVASTITSGFSVGSSPTGGPFTVTGSQSIQAGGNATFMLSVLANNVVSTSKNGSLEVLTLSSPSINLEVGKLVNLVQMPVSTTFSSSPLGLASTLVGSNNTYSSTVTNATPGAVTSVRAVASSTVEDFNPLHVFAAKRTISASSSGTPLVTDQIQFENLGTIPLTQIYVSPLALPTTKVTIVTATADEPVLLAPFTLALSSGAVNLATFVVGYPSDGVQVGTNFTLTYQYPLGSNYYSVSGGQVTLKIPDPPGERQQRLYPEPIRVRYGQ